MNHRAVMLRSINAGTRMVNGVLAQFWSDVREIVQRWRGVSLNDRTRPAMLAEVDREIARVFGATRQTAHLSALYLAIVQSTDLAASRTLASHVGEMRKIAGPDLWHRVVGSPVLDDRFRQAIEVVEGRSTPEMRQEVLRAQALNPDRAWVPGSRKKLGDRVHAVGRKVKKTVHDVAKKARKVVDLIPGLKRPGSSMPGDAAARTIVQTETARVSNEAERMMTWIVPSHGLQYVLSSDHPRADACDPRANEDRYGLGRGVFPPGEAPMPPIHPRCRCSVQQIALDPERVRAWMERRYGS